MPEDPNNRVVAALFSGGGISVLEHRWQDLSYAEQKDLLYRWRMELAFMIKDVERESRGVWASGYLAGNRTHHFFPIEQEGLETEVTRSLCNKMSYGGGKRYREDDPNNCLRCKQIYRMRYKD